MDTTPGKRDLFFDLGYRRQTEVIPPTRLQKVPSEIVYVQPLHDMVRKIRSSLASLVSDAQERGLVARNVVRELGSGRKRGKERRADRRQKGKLRVGVDIPTPAEIREFLHALPARWRPLFLTATFTGLRASELRGLHWGDVDLPKRELHVRRRADRYNRIGPPKSEAGERAVPLIASVVNALREHKLAS